jgi:hypothetical protein
LILHHTPTSPTSSAKIVGKLRLDVLGVFLMGATDFVTVARPRNFLTDLDLRDIEHASVVLRYIISER